MTSLLLRCNYVGLRFSCVFDFFFSSRRRHTRCALVTGVQTCALPIWAAPRRPGVDYQSSQNESLKVRVGSRISSPLRLAKFGLRGSPGPPRHPSNWFQLRQLNTFST